ncbi:MAG TPA: hypothetical protein VGZ73_12295 [Bryobacteraceae bacterium]|jgi:hypothetical protein|nr:hypothetical protein [Bryobacteraceae bacterium]
MAHKKDPAAVALGRKGGIKGGPARAAKLTAAERSESARKAVRARWTKANPGSGHKDLNTQGTGIKKSRQFPNADVRETVPDGPGLDTSKKALHLCLKRIKDATDENELRRLTEELQRIVFHKQYQNAEN